jgi:hypothetical protein
MFCHGEGKLPDGFAAGGTVMGLGIRSLREHFLFGRCQSAAGRASDEMATNGLSIGNRWANRIRSLEVCHFKGRPCPP